MICSRRSLIYRFPFPFPRYFFQVPLYLNKLYQRGEKFKRGLKNFAMKGLRKTMSIGKFDQMVWMLFQPLSPSSKALSFQQNRFKSLVMIINRRILSLFTSQIGFIFCCRHTPSTIREIINITKTHFCAQLNRDGTIRHSEQN